MENKKCPKCFTEMVEQSYVDPETHMPVNHEQCFKCGYSEEIDSTTKEYRP